MTTQVTSYWSMVSPNVFKNTTHNNASIAEMVKRLNTKMDTLLSCGFLSNMIESRLRANPPHLDNCTDWAHNACDIEEVNPMASKHRLRAVIGFDDTGAPIIKQISASSETALADAIVNAFIKSGRIRDFISIDKQTLPPSKHLFSEYINYWRQTYKQGGAKSTQVFRDAKQTVLLNYFGNMDIEDIKVETVQQFLDFRAFKEGRSKVTVRADLVFLKELLDCAVKDGIIPTNPAKDSRINNNGEAGEGTRALTPAQYKAIRDSIPALTDDTERLALSLFAYTSLRREEAMALRWANVDFDTMVINIDSALTFVSGKADLKATKTKESKRPFPMSAELAEILKPLRRDFGFVISNSDKGEAMSVGTFRGLWKRLASHIELYGATPINFRTTFVTLGIAGGVDPRTMAKLCGHSNTNTTMNVYSKVVNDQLPQAMKTLDNYLSN